MPPFLISPAAKLLLVLLTLLAVFGSGLYVGVEWEEGRQAKLDVERGKQEMDNVRASVERSRKVIAAIQRGLDDERAGRAKDKSRFERRLRDANPRDLAVCVERPAGGNVDVAQDGTPPTDPVALTSAFVRLWNDALCQGVAEGACAKRADDPSFGAGFVVPKDILGNAGVNAESCAEDRARLKGWQRWAREQGFTE